MNSELRLVDVEVHYGQLRAVTSTSLDVAEGEILALLGPSGCGKSTLLRAIAGLEPLAAGSIRWRGTDLAHIAAHKRNFSLMFQDHALFPHRNVADNVGFGLRMAKMERSAAQRRVAEMLDLVGLANSGDRSVGTLSGGESQRVALARALAPKPEVLLLDEPLGSLDSALRDRLAQQIRSIVTSLGITTIHVTHDRDEAVTVSDRLALMDRGRISRTGDIEALMANPQDVATAQALGIETVLSGKADERQRLHTAFGDIEVQAQPGTQVHVLLRPHSVRLATEGVAAQVVGARYRSGLWWLTCRPEDGPEIVAQHEQRLKNLSAVFLQAQLRDAAQLGSSSKQ